MIRRIARRMAIFDETVLINDNQHDSLYFEVADVPDEFTAGKNMFRIHGNHELLQSNSQILIQVLDISGKPIYHHVNTFIDIAGRVVIGVYVYPETPVGIGKLQIMGIATSRPGGQPIPQSWQGRYNVRWERNVSVVAVKKNKSPIIFQTIPGVKMAEKVRNYLTQEYVSGTAATQSFSSPISYTYPGYGQGIITCEEAYFTADMEGGIINVPNPNVSLGAGVSLSTEASSSYTGYISAVVNSTQVQVSPYILSVQSTNNSGGSVTGVVGKTTQISTVNSSYPPSSFGPISTYTVDWNQTATYASGSNNQQSFASITLKNLDPIIGNVHSVKTWMKSAGYATYQLMSEEVLEDRDLLINVDSNLAYDRLGDFRNQAIIDTYWASESVNQPGNEFQVIHSDEQMISSMVITGSSLLSSSTNYPNNPLDTDPYIKVYNTSNTDIYKDNEYNLEFRVAAEADPSGQVSASHMDIYISGSNIAPSDGRNIGHKLVALKTTNAAPSNNTTVGAYVGLSSLLNNPSSGVSSPYATMGGVSNNALGEESLEVAANFAANSAASVESHTYGQFDQRLLQLSYTPSQDTGAHIVFAVTRGKWHVADVRLVGASDRGFTPNHTFFEVPLSTPQQDDVLDFKFQFYNSQAEIGNITMLTQSMDFTGSNTYISGDNNEISGSLFIGNGIIMQGFTR